MKRYWLFACAHYYPNGGLSDLKGTFDKWEDCLFYIDKNYYKCYREVDEFDEYIGERKDYSFNIFDSKTESYYSIEDEEIETKCVWNSSKNGFFYIKGDSNEL